MKALRIKKPAQVLERLRKTLISELDKTEIDETGSTDVASHEKKVVSRASMVMKIRKSTRTLTSYM